MSHRQRVGRAARKLLETLDVLEASDFVTCEHDVHRLIRQAASPDALSPRDVWEEAVEIEGDPLRRQRHVLGRGWRPNLT
ncbi:MAG: hypothetical protein AAFQ82_28540 [Myxococcota bacterium]